MHATVNRRDELLLGLFVRERRGWTGEPSKQVVHSAGDRCRVGPPMRLGRDVVAACMRLAGGMNHAALVYVRVRACLQACAFTFCPSDVHKAHGARGTSASRRQAADYPRNVTFTHSSAQLYSRQHACMPLKVIRAPVWCFPCCCSSLGRVG